MKSLTLSDGVTLSPGAAACIPVQQHALDTSVYPNPRFFARFRFSKLREEKVDRKAEYLFAAVNSDTLGFGRGRYAFSGRVLTAA